MIICMSDIICVTNRLLCREDFELRIEKIAKEEPKAVILREKDLPEQEYAVLAKRATEICAANKTQLIMHSFPNVAFELECKAIHLPLPILRSLTDTQKAFFEILGTSCHSTDDAKEAEKLGCTYIIAGHIYDTDCKKGLPGRGVSFLKDVCASVSIPVYAIGGISKSNAHDVRAAGASGFCVMSSIMECENPHDLLKML